MWDYKERNLLTCTSQGIETPQETWLPVLSFITAAAVLVTSVLSIEHLGANHHSSISHLKYLHYTFEYYLLHWFPIGAITSASNLLA